MVLSLTLSDTEEAKLLVPSLDVRSSIFQKSVCFRQALNLISSHLTNPFFFPPLELRAEIF